MCVYACVCVCVCVKSLQSCLTLCNPIDHSPRGSSVPEILQAQILECIACPLSGDIPYLGIKLVSLRIPALAGGFFTTRAI